MGTFKRKKRPKGPWDYLIEKGMNTEENYEKWEEALERGDYEEAERLMGETVSGIKERKKD